MFPATVLDHLIVAESIPKLRKHSITTLSLVFRVTRHDLEALILEAINLPLWHFPKQPIGLDVNFSTIPDFFRKLCFSILSFLWLK